MGWSRRACVLWNGSFSRLYGCWASVQLGRGKFELPKYYLEKVLSLVWRPPPSSGLACSDGPWKNAEPQEGRWAVLPTTSLDLILWAWLPAGMFPADNGWKPGTWGIISLRDAGIPGPGRADVITSVLQMRKTDLLGLSDLSRSWWWNQNPSPDLLTGAAG